MSFLAVAVIGATLCQVELWLSPQVWASQLGRRQIRLEAWS